MTKNVPCASPAEIALLRAQCLKYKEGAEILEKYSNATLAQHIYNGAGPDAWTADLRAILTKAMEIFSPVVLIHDTQYFESDGSYGSFKKTAKIWKVNTRKILDAEYPLWTLDMLSREYRIRRAYWWGVMEATNKAIAGRSAYEAYQSACRARAEVKNA